MPLAPGRRLKDACSSLPYYYNTYPLSTQFTKQALSLTEKGEEGQSSSPFLRDLPSSESSLLKPYGKEGQGKTSSRRSARKRGNPRHFTEKEN
jgi:hypothetical protein